MPTDPLNDAPDPAPAPPPRSTPALDDRRAHVVRRGERAWIDYSHELRIQRNPVLRSTYLVLGVVCVAFGAIGVVVPGWPTTVWILVATYFFARSSPRFYNWLMNHRVFGPLIRDWRDGKGLSARAKGLAVTTIVLSIGTSIVLIPPVWAKPLLVVVAVTLCTYLLTLPTKPRTA
ncbi:MAG: YbaN family protein [Trueperaceae bacterium]|nr:YbaN family protein [Trueperaceae bacterium]